MTQIQADKWFPDFPAADWSSTADESYKVLLGDDRLPSKAHCEGGELGPHNN